MSGYQLQWQDYRGHAPGQRLPPRQILNFSSKELAKMEKQRLIASGDGEIVAIIVPKVTFSVNWD